MSGRPIASKRVFGPSKNMLISIGFVLGLLLSLFAAAALKNGDWEGFAVILASGAALFTMASLVRLEIDSVGLGHRTPLGWRLLEFESIERARVEVVNRRGRGAATLCMESQNGRQMRIFLRRYPIEASAAMFRALESHGIRIEIPDRRAQYWAKQVRAASADAAK